MKVMLLSSTKIVELRNVRKTFGALTALDNVNFSAEKGEIHGLLGENGAGKSTLMNILYGLYRPDQGEIIFDGHPLEIKSPSDSIGKGIGMVHQISTLVPEFNAVENIVLGSTENKYSMETVKEQEKIREISSLCGLAFPFNVKTKELTAGIKQKIEIVRALYRGAKLLILDEPTTSLVEKEFEQLLYTLQSLVKDGLTVIFITHKMREVMQTCDAVTVLKGGKVQGKLAKEEMSKEQLVKMMFMEKDIAVTESALPKIALPPKEKSKEPICRLDEVSLSPSDKTPGLKKISLEAYGGEILGICAVSGNGEKDLATCLADPSRIESGDYYIKGEKVNDLDTLSLFKKGVFYTPSDRISEAILPEASLKENILLGHHTEDDFLQRNIFINWKKARESARKVISDYDVKAPDERTEIRRLSGGNIQRVIIGRGLINEVDLFITHNPSSGLDIASVEFIFNKLLEIRQSDRAVIWINEDLDELMLLSDRIGILYNGELRAIVPRDKFDKYELGLLMIGG
jgi:general nucleoside transport system ATP-binding protein